MKKMAWALLLAAILLSLAGCSKIENALQEIGSQYEENEVDTPTNNGGDIDWSFVPVVRDLAVNTFNYGFPDAQVVNTIVASDNGRDDHVIVIIEYAFEDGRSGEYGFDYKKNDEGEYELTRYGDGVKVDDL